MLQADNNVVKNSKFYATYYWLDLNTGADNNTFYNNYISTNYGIATTNSGNYFNTTFQTGTNIYNSSIGNISGNYWTNSTSGGYSTTCTDSDGNGFCDSPYNLTSETSCTTGVDCGTAVDYMAISDNYGQGTPAVDEVWYNGSVWKVNCTVPSGSGYQDLKIEVNYTTDNIQRNDTKNNAIKYAGAIERTINQLFTSSLDIDRFFEGLRSPSISATGTFISERFITMSRLTEFGLTLLSDLQRFFGSNNVLDNLFSSLFNIDRIFGANRFFNQIITIAPDLYTSVTSVEYYKYYFIHFRFDRYLVQ